MRKKLNIQNNKGMSLIELLIVIIISSTVILLGLQTYSSQENTSYVQKEVQYVRTLNDCIQNFALPQISFQKVAITDVYNTGCFPSEVAGTFNTGTGVWTLAWGTATYDVETVTSSTNAGDLYAWTFSSVPAQACPLFVSSLVSSAYDITINGTLAGLNRTGTSASDTVFPQPRMSQILPLCTAASTVPIKVRFFKFQSPMTTNGKYTSNMGFGFQPGLIAYTTTDPGVPRGTPEAVFDSAGETVAENILADNANAYQQWSSAQKALP